MLPIIPTFICVGWGWDGGVRGSGGALGPPTGLLWPCPSHVTHRHVVNKYCSGFFLHIFVFMAEETCCPFFLDDAMESLDFRQRWDLTAAPPLLPALKGSSESIWDQSGSTVSCRSVWWTWRKCWHRSERLWGNRWVIRQVTHTPAQLLDGTDSQRVFQRRVEVSKGEFNSVNLNVCVWITMK